PDIEARVNSATPRAACQNLLDMVLARGGTDNVTIVLVRVGGGRNGALHSDRSAVEGLAR
ncbi:serine/threonine-protein phosphatase, partial [Mesorhizobium sp. M00.F.Ca.ET.149.01.1.1]